ncbi:hypothetical protein GCM10022251_33550 [Phytohabitans flavus]|uniref:Ricin B lectin domain-containing protein n=1 Tax=Phytohabitans flavus TaxID=1076124 RepID=A0A6F8XNA0_9ACTN|nr:RICIN domain-containing protein [Phytohabitans flavus]BCB75290.1 hypothetical protein Pflav_017000 [Phytohabitans flavus]
MKRRSTRVSLALVFGLLLCMLVPGPSAMAAKPVGATTPVTAPAARTMALKAPAANAADDNLAYPLATRVGSGCAVAQGSGNVWVNKAQCYLQFADQHWRFVDVGEGWFEIQNANTPAGATPRCLVVQGKAGESRALVFPCAGFADQHWKKTWAPNGFQLRNRYSDLCLVMRVNNADARQVKCDNSFADQVWFHGMPNAPTKSPNSNLIQPVYFLHGYDSSTDGPDGEQYWGNTMAQFRQVPVARAT